MSLMAMARSSESHLNSTPDKEKIIGGDWDQMIDHLDFAFQPIVNIHSGVCFGFEALLRGYRNFSFNNPHKGRKMTPRLLLRPTKSRFGHPLAQGFGGAQIRRRGCYFGRGVGVGLGHGPQETAQSVDILNTSLTAVVAGEKAKPNPDHALLSGEDGHLD